MNALDRHIVECLQHGLPLGERPYRDAAALLGTDEATLITRLEALLADGVLSRFGPLFNVERGGGAFSLCALAVPEERFDEVAEQVNALPEVAHNYEREHRFNMWFVLATETPDGIARAIAEIERRSGLEVFDFPKRREFFVGLRFRLGPEAA